MAMTDQELKFALDNEEPRYPEIAARLDESDVPRVRALAESGDVALASKAVYLASLLESGDDIVARAALSPDPLIRVASATALSNLSASTRDRVAEGLIDDDNPSVAKLVLRALDAPPPALAARVRALESRSDHPELRELARRALRENE